MLLAMEMDLQTLSARLEMANFKERRKLAAEAAKDASPEDLEQITRLLGHEQEPVRLGAIEILALAKFRKAIKYLAAVTVQKTGDEQVLAARAVTMMAQPDDRSVLEPLARKWMAVSNHFLKDCAARLLVKLGAVSSPAQAEKVAAEKPKPAQPAIPGAGITASDQAKRKEAIERTIASADDPAQILVDALREKQPPGVRLDLITGLEWLGPEGLAGAALQLLPKCDSTVVSLLARALTRHIGDLPIKRASQICDALDQAKRNNYGDGLVAEAVAECLRAAPK